MPYSFKIDTENKVALFNANGAFTADILLNCLEEVTAVPGFRSNFDHLVDLREVTSFPATASDIHTRINLDRHLKIPLGECKIAIVSSNELVYGMSRMYEMMMENALPQVHNFRNMNEAIAWLGLPADIVK